MFRKLLPIHVLAVLAASALLPSPVRGQDIYKVYDAYAYMFAAPADCEYINTTVDVFESWRAQNEGGRMEHAITLYFRSSDYDFCEDLLISYIMGSVEIPASAFRTQGLKSATLQVVIDFRDEALGAIVPVIFDLTWTCLESSREGKPSHGVCGIAELSGSVLVRGRNLVDSDNGYSEARMVNFKKKR